MRWLLLVLVLLGAGCKQECVPPGWHCGTIQARVRSTITGASYAVLADGTNVSIPYDQFDQLTTGQRYCGPVGIYPEPTPPAP